MTRGVSKSGYRRVPAAPGPEDKSIADCVSYDPETGEFTWKVNRGTNAMAGKRAGSVWRRKGDARYVIAFNGRGYQGNRVAWLIMTGEWPAAKVDHGDCDSLNNRWGNLRLATTSQNAANARRRKDNTTGHKGVTYRSLTRKFVARIQHDHKRIWLGHFSSLEEAREAYERAAKDLHGEFGRAA